MPLSGQEILGWGRLAREVTVVSVPGTHQTCLTEHLDVVGEHLRTALA